MLKTAITTFVVGLLAILAWIGGAHVVNAGDAGGNPQSPSPSAQVASTTANTNATPTAVANLQPTNRYVALGDSVAAGVGLTPPSTALDNDRTCRRTTAAYPYTVAQQRGLELTHVACSGAKATNLLVWQGISSQPNPRRQISNIFVNGRPELVTITAGANDLRWTYYVNKCRVSRCGPDAQSRLFSDSGTDTRVINRLLEGVQLKYDAFFAELNLRSGGNPPTVVVTGYYDPVSEACLSQFPSISAAELQWLRGTVAALNQTIKQTVERYPNARFAPVDFSGHDLCSGQSWIQGLNDPMPLHPTAEGQQVIARAVLAAVE